MRYPITVKHRKAAAKIYGKSEAFPYYRVCWSSAGSRHSKSFPAYSAAREFAEKLVRDLHQGKAGANLSNRVALEAVTAQELLDQHRAATGRTISLTHALSEFLRADKILDGSPLLDVIKKYQSTLATIRPVEVAAAVAEFLKSQQAKTGASPGQRGQLSAKYVYQLEIILERVAAAFPATQLMDLGKSHLEVFLTSLEQMSPKSRNHYRAAIKNLLGWAARMDFVPPAHRLAECEALRPERRSNQGEIEFYTPGELRLLLDTADENLRPMLAISALGGLRTAECFRITWQDVFRVEGHLEVSARKSKTRQRRLVEICPALANWLAPCKARTGPVWPLRETAFHEAFERLCEALELSRKANGLRHSYVTYHFALHQNEGRTAAQAGNTPGMVHSNYRGLATRSEGEAWFSIAPSPVAGNVIPLLPAATA